MIARHSRRVASYLRFVLVGDWDQYSIGFSVPSGRCCSSLVHSIWTSQSSTSSDMRPVLLGRAKTGAGISAFSSEFVDFDSFSLTGPKVVGWSFCSLALSGAERRAKIEINFRKSFRIPKKDQTSKMFVGVFILRIASVVCDANLRRVRRVQCLRHTNLSAKNQNFLT